jgi:hypothetical protein
MKAGLCKGRGTGFYRYPWKVRGSPCNRPNTFQGPVQSFSRSLLFLLLDKEGSRGGPGIYPRVLRNIQSLQGFSGV